MRVWERPVAEIMAGGLATVPLPSLASLPEDKLPALVEAIRQRIDRETTGDQAERLWKATYLLMGLNHPDHLIDRYFQRVSRMEESFETLERLTDRILDAASWEDLLGDIPPIPVNR